MPWQFESKKYNHKTIPMLIMVIIIIIIIIVNPGGYDNDFDKTQQGHAVYSNAKNDMTSAPSPWHHLCHVVTQLQIVDHQIFVYTITFLIERKMASTMSTSSIPKEIEEAHKGQP